MELRIGPATDRQGTSSTNLPDSLPQGLEIFSDEAVPILRRRGLFRQEYSGRTLRDHLGLARPLNPNAAAVE
ncbi:luciferase-like monooxygenase domain-containing protein (plasmid) [Rhizobium phaseoli Brasil 5]|nr:luciferase-like monooxygenase domain-containing protein [Rhizobium phaseoli Brasil 5]